jgi:hypothetical protein
VHGEWQLPYIIIVWAHIAIKNNIDRFDLLRSAIGYREYPKAKQDDTIFHIVSKVIINFFITGSLDKKQALSCNNFSYI